MTDLLFVVVIVLFFVAAALFVRACGRLIGERPIDEPGEDA